MVLRVIVGLQVTGIPESEHERGGRRRCGLWSGVTVEVVDAGDWQGELRVRASESE